MVCAWYFLVSVVERDRTEYTWAIQQGLPKCNTAEKYLRSYYFMLNVATGIGSGDMFPSNELERFFISILMTTGDVLWSFGFGLIVYFWGLKRSMNEKKEDLENKINALQELMDANEISAHSKQRMEKYFAYHFYKQQNSWVVDKNELMQHLPVAVVQQIVVQTNEEIFKVIFKNLLSENLIRDLCLALEVRIFTPQDFIFNKGDASNDIFFIVDGTVHLIAEDQITIVMTLTTGQYFGEIGVLSGAKRQTYVQAATFCLLNSLSKENLEQISMLYPQLKQTLEDSANLKKQLIEEKNVHIQSTKGKEVNRLMDLLLDDSFVSESEKDVRIKNGVRRDTNMFTNQRRHSFGFLESRLGNDQSQVASQLGRYPSSLKNVGLSAATKTKSGLRRNTMINVQQVPQFTQQALPGNVSRGRLVSEESKELEAGSQLPADSKDKPVKRRLSDCSLGATQMVSNYTGLKLQWNVQNNQMSYDFM